MKMNLQIITQEKTAYSGEVDQLTVPTTDGEITILADHIPLITALNHGELVIKNDGKETPMAVCGGFIEVKKNQITVITDIAERVEEIDEKKAQEAKIRAQKLLEEKDRLSDVAFADATSMLERSLARLKLAKRRRKK